MENAKLYKKLVTAKGDMSVKDDNKNFMVHRKYVQHMSKVPQAHQYQSNISPERERSIDMTSNASALRCHHQGAANLKSTKTLRKDPNRNSSGLPVICTERSVSNPKHLNGSDVKNSCRSLKELINLP